MYRKMDDYIKREDALYSINNNVLSIHGSEIDGREALDAIADIPAADVRKNVRGDWVYQNPLFVDTIMCSVCGYNLPSDEFKTNFCPDMRGEKE